MASSAEINAKLEWLQRSFADVREAVGRWSDLADPERTSLSADWWQAVTDLCDLRAAAERGELTSGQHQRLMATLVAIRELRPALIEHHLAVPSEEQLAVA